MTKHDFHIALVLLSLITAGTLGYQSLNAVSVNETGNCTIVLYFSSFDGCSSRDPVDIQSPSFLNKRLQNTTAPEKMGMFEIDAYKPDNISHKRNDFSVGMYASTLQLDPSSMQRVDQDRTPAEIQIAHISFLLSDVHREFIDQVKMYQ